MLIFKISSDISRYITELKSAGQSVGFVPTMGALHDGHLSLIRAAKQAGHISICSIFVNPTQFNNPADLERYPRTTEDDILLLTKAGCDVLFLPSDQEMYPDGVGQHVHYDLGDLEHILEGKYRPGHFQGVALIVDKLLAMIQPDALFMGQKDFQQCMVIAQLIKQQGLKTILKCMPTRREADGLAMSSRNRRMTPSQRSLAGLIYQCLVSIQTKQDELNFPVVQKECFELLTQKGFRCDYIELADADTLALLDNYDTSRRMVALIAASIGDIRLIDNLIV